MYKKSTSEWLKHWDFMMVDVVCMEAAFAIAYLARNGTWEIHCDMYKIMVGYICMASLCAGFFTENYRDVLHRGYWKEFKAAALHVFAAEISLFLYMFILKASFRAFRAALMLFSCTAVLFVYAGRLLLKKWRKSHPRAVKGKRSVMLLCEESNYQTLAGDFLGDPFSEFRVACIALIHSSENKKGSFRGIPVIIGEKAALSYILSDWIDEVFISLSGKRSVSEDFAGQCRLMGVTLHTSLAKTADLAAGQFVEEIEGYTVLSDSVSIATPVQIFLKRCLDIAGGIVGCLITGILFLVVGPAIYVKSPGPVFFRQERVGKNGRRFYMYKFRSMYMDAEERKQEFMEKNNIKDGRMFKLHNDPRIIKGVGKFIREYSIDEFPQFWNVLKGDMSLVGTRPPTVDEWEKYEAKHRGRLAIRPGITGMWQVHGRSDITDFNEVVRLDKEYIARWSIGLDFKILFQTIGVVLKKKGAS